MSDLTCWLCERELQSDRMFRTAGFVQAPLLCDTCGTRLAAYELACSEMKREQLRQLRELQTQILADLQGLEINIKSTTGRLAAAERKARKQARIEGQLPDGLSEEEALKQ